MGSILKKLKENETLEVQISNNFLMDRCLFGKLMAAILKTLEGVMQVAGDIICNVIRLVFTGIRIVLNSIHSLINARIKVPFLSDLYKYIAKDELTFSDLISLILALPVSGYCRVVFHENLMPDDAALENFKRDISFKQLFTDEIAIKAVPQKSQNAYD